MSWHPWFPVSGGMAALGSPSTAIARNPDHLDLFVTGLLALTLSIALALPTRSQASEITVKFDVAPDVFDPRNVTTAGYFYFDSSIIPAGGGSLYNPYGLGISTMHFSWDGVPWGPQGDAGVFRLDFDAGGTLTGWGIGGERPYDDLYCGSQDFVLCSDCSSYRLCNSLACFDRGASYGFEYMPGEEPCGPSSISWYSGRLNSWSIAPVIQASIDIDPNTIQASSGGRFVTAYIQLPPSSDPTAINISTIRLNGTIPALPKPALVRDHNEDGTPDLMVKCDRASLSSLPLGPNEIHVTGRLFAGDMFEGSDVISVVGPSGSSASTLSLDVLSASGQTPVQYVVRSQARATHTIRMFDAQGRLVRSWREPVVGSAKGEWDGLRADGSRASSGVYFMRVESGRDGVTRKVLVAR